MTQSSDKEVKMVNHAQDAESVEGMNGFVFTYFVWG